MLTTNVFKFHIRFYCNLFSKGYSVKYSTKAKPVAKKESFKETIFLPKTEFEVHHENVVERDRNIEKLANFPECYAWQREHMKGKEFVLHDGPPYANGEPHVGHAINKVLKDIILRSQLVQGNRVHFVPGWDCHGLPIELIALKSVDSNTQLTPLEIRSKSRELAYSQMEVQKNAFKKWGLLGDWDNTYYFTDSIEYVANQLLFFWELYSKGYIYRALKPVHWSPSTETALASAELVYKDDHISRAVTVRFEITTESSEEPMYLLIWTTTPWTLPLNKAIFFTKELEYSLVKISSLQGSYIMATECIDEYKKKLNKEISIVRTVPHEELKTMRYKHHWKKDTTMKVFDSPKVNNVATGLLHSVPAHGFDDFLLGMMHGLGLECFVDEKGCYTKDIGSDLHGLYVLGEGLDRVIEKLSSDVIMEEKYVHSYPYDWRTYEPVIIRASHQWFIDIEKLKAKAVASLSEVSAKHSLENDLRSRPYWCLSRQRAWGVPIPVFFDKTTGRALLSEDLIRHLHGIFLKTGSDAWWSYDINALFPRHFCEKFQVEIENVQRGNDIMDIWFDSGISWSFVLGDKVADVCVEGIDQYGGWFQTSLLTSVASRERAPYKKLVVHGYAVDENGNKMSKSTGNVFDPMSVVEGDKAFGVDVLRWWVACHGQQSSVPISVRLLEDTKIEVVKMKLIFKFLLGSLNGVTRDEIDNASPLYSLDRYVLDLCHDVYHSIMASYNSHDFFKACFALINFVVNDISSLYLFSIKDRLYCDGFNMERRQSCIHTLSGILDTLCHCVAPVMPHLVEEIYLHHPHRGGKKFFYNENMWVPPPSWKTTPTAKDAVDLAKHFRREILKVSLKTNQFSCSIRAEGRDYDLLKELQGGTETSTDSELTELLQVAAVDLKVGNRDVELKPATGHKCPRCRRYVAAKQGVPCTRCETVIASIVSP